MISKQASKRAEHEVRGGIYAIRNLVTQKKYVGSAVCIAKRVSQHRRSLQSRKHHSIKLQRAWDKYGAAAFEFVVLAIVEEPTLLLQHEQTWIDFLDSVAEGYNMAATAGSLLGFKHTPETRQRMSTAHTGKTKTPEHMAAIAAALRGRPLSPETCQKMSKAKLGRPCGPQSPEHRAKISAANKGKAKSPQHIAASLATRARRFAARKTQPAA